ncbi:MAG: protein-export chaperone SecB, partial [Parvibaculales bacterium]
MSETPNENQTAETAAPGLQIMVQYVRDLSFENPGAPNFADMQPEINVNANVGARKLSDTDYEVGLKFRIEAK